MFFNNIKIALRNLLKFKSFSLINIFGLAIGIASCVLIMLFVADELSYDKFYKNSDRIYRIHTEVKLGDNESKMAVSPAILAHAMVNEIPEVEKAVRLRWQRAPVFRYEDKVFSEGNILWVDSTYFEVFNCEFLEGTPESALATKDALVITESMRNKYFGNSSALGKVITEENFFDLKVTAVIKDFPTNSHFRLDFLANLSLLPPDEYDSRWMASNYFTYVLLKEGTDLNNFQKKLDNLVIKYAAPEIETYIGTAFETLVGQGSYYRLLYQPLTDIHLHSDLLYELDVNSDISYVYIFSIIAFIILAIACINFINLSTARSTTRAKEVGIRKTLGSNRLKLIIQFLTESSVIALLAVMLAVLIINLAVPYFNNVSGKTLAFSLTDNYLIIPGLLIFSLSIGILAGLYPAFLLTSFNPVNVIKGEKQFKGRSYWLRNGLVVFQFAVSVILFIGTLVVKSQLGYMQNKKLGYDKDQLLVIEKSNDLNNRYEAFKTDLLKNSSVLNVSSQNSIPGRGFGITLYRLENDESNGNYQMMIWFADFDLINTYNIDMAEGRYFSKEFTTDSSAVVINEAAKKALGLENAVGKRLYDASAEPRWMQIVGVVKDFHFESMHTKVRPMIIIPQSSTGEFTSVKIAGGDIQETVKFIEETWNKYSNGQAFQFVFMDDEFNRIYSAELKTGELFTSFSILAIIIACLGLFGLSAFITIQKTKEIGIRKVLGASTENILYLLVKEFTKWVVLANIIAWPVSYFIMSNWLEGFAYRVDINFSIFILSALGSLVIAFITVSSQVIKAASKNPIISLKYE